ncbi:MAG: AbfB domain-containing protein [Fuerstiella sp.]
MLALALCLGHSAIADIYEEIEAAEEAFRTTIVAAKQELTVHYQEAIVAATMDGKFDKATGITSRLELFASDGLLMENNFGDEYAQYGWQISRAKERLLDAYGVAIAKFAKDGQLSEIKGIQYKIRDRGLTAKWVSIRSTAYRNKYLLHANYKGVMEKVAPLGSKLNATFEMRIGLISDGAVYGIVGGAVNKGKLPSVVSFRSFNVPSMYLAHGDHALVLARVIDSDGARQNASFRVQKSFYRSSATSFEAVNLPGHFLVVQDDRVVLMKHNASAEFAKAATFDIVSPRFKFQPANE